MIKGKKLLKLEEKERQTGKIRKIWSREKNFRIIRNVKQKE
jgi:hypothetical protein